MQPGTPMVDLFPLGQAALRNQSLQRRPNPPPGFGPRQVMRPTHNLLRASFTYTDQNIHRQRDAEEASARRVMFEAQLEIEASQRENLLRQELQELQFAEALTLQAQQDLQRWEVQERATCEARLRTAEHQLYQEAAQAHHQTEAASLRYFHHLRAEIQEAETSYRTSVQQETEVFTLKWREEVQYHANSSAQAQSVLSAERQQHQRDLKEQAERWQASLDIVTEGAQEEILERNDTIEELTQYLEETAQEMEHYEEWCETYQQELAFTETNQLFQDFNREDESEAEAQAQKPLLSTAPLTPAVCFGSSLTTQHLPPPTLPFQRASPSNPARLEEQQEQKVAEEEAARASQEWEAHRDAELREALFKIQRLEESQQASVGGQAPTLPTTQAYPPGNTTGLTIGQPSPVLPSSANRGPWAATRERFQMMTSLPQTPLVAGASTGVPTVAAPSAVASTHGAALPAMMVQNPTAPLGALPSQPLCNLIRKLYLPMNISRGKRRLYPSWQ